jgi:hypothetical protein
MEFWVDIPDTQAVTKAECPKCGTQYEIAKTLNDGDTFGLSVMMKPPAPVDFIKLDLPTQAHVDFEERVEKLRHDLVCSLGIPREYLEPSLTHIAETVVKHEDENKIQKRFVNEEDAGPAKALSQHDPYAIVDTPNPNGRAICEPILTYHGTGSLFLPHGSKLTDCMGTPIFETYEEARFHGHGANCVVGAMAIKPGVAGNIDCHVITGVDGYERGLLTADNPFPGMGGAELKDGVLVTGERPEMPNLGAILDRREGMRPDSTIQRQIDEEAVNALVSAHGFREWVEQQPKPWKSAFIMDQLGIKIVAAEREGGTLAMVLSYREKRMFVAVCRGRITLYRHEDEDGHLQLPELTENYEWEWK